MQKISSGIKSFDRLIDFYYIGDNVVWEVDSGAPYKVFLQNFIRQSFNDSQKIIYISFNRSPQSILKSVKDFLNPKHFILVDCFTSGKGKNDITFARFYETLRWALQSVATATRRNEVKRHRRSPKG